MLISPSLALILFLLNNNYSLLPVQSPLNIPDEKFMVCAVGSLNIAAYGQHKA